MTLVLGTLPRLSAQYSQVSTHLDVLHNSVIHRYLDSIDNQSITNVVLLHLHPLLLSTPSNTSRKTPINGPRILDRSTHH
ncbi:hypothetical protein LENED_004149 [Lentinula edodes]|uniref:Uncharacterized protein n=1 Tax=Lentinula edodes TaxID=5353 RepID=A0A1Q3E5P9_LENED|nr:hypothetical protein LENED_004149 [Lentinula edodes]